jgi:hypothetical protein
MSIFSNGGGTMKGAGLGRIADKEPMLAGSLSLSVVGDGSHHYNERDWTCWAGRRRHNDEQGKGIEKGRVERHWDGPVRMA